MSAPTCPVCIGPIEDGDATAILPIEPADDVERAKMLRHEPYESTAAVVHAACSRVLLVYAGAA